KQFQSSPLWKAIKEKEKRKEKEQKNSTNFSRSWNKSGKPIRNPSKKHHADIPFFIQTKPFTSQANILPGNSCSTFNKSRLLNHGRTSPESKRCQLERSSKSVRRLSKEEI
ncbi:hypothetical protein VIGAN_02225600, partial [Vigna angularis var. angularis]